MDERESKRVDLQPLESRSVSRQRNISPDPANAECKQQVTRRYDKGLVRELYKKICENDAKERASHQHQERVRKDVAHMDSSAAFGSTTDTHRKKKGEEIRK